MKTDYPMVVKITQNDDGDPVESPRWHYITDHGDSERTLCRGEVFGRGEGRAVFKIKRGKITCPICIRFIKEFKAIKL